MANTTGKKWGGRSKGTPNKTTIETRKAYQEFVEGNLDNLQQWLEQLEDPAEKLEFMLKFSEYFVPKLARVEHTGEGGKDLTVNLIQFTNAKPRLE